MCVIRKGIRFFHVLCHSDHFFPPWTSKHFHGQEEPFPPPSKNEGNFKNKDTLKNEDKIKNEDDLKDEDDLKNEDDLKHEDDLKMETT